MESQELASACAARMLEGDRASASLGIELMGVQPGAASMRMQVRGDMVNGHGMCHGGLITTLADSTFAVACNTYDVVTVASGLDITFIESAREADVLEASAVERSRRGRSGLYDISVRRASDGVVVAEMRGRSRALNQPILG